MSKRERALLEEIIRGYIASLESEQYRAERDTGKAFPAYTKKIAEAKDLRKKILGE